MENFEGRRRWGVEQRLEFIEFRLFWEGGVNRSDLTHQFGVSVPQASTDLSLYRDLAPANIRYDSSEKRYIATPEFEPRFLRPNPDRYLAQIKAMADGVMQISETWLARPPAADAMPVPTRPVNAGLLRDMLAAIRDPKSIEINYVSMNPERPATLWRRITPHAFGFEGLRWHVRAFCHIDNYFKDFLLSRTLGIRNQAEPGPLSVDDVKWHSFFEVLLQPNPELSSAQRRTVEIDYNMYRGTAAIKVRCALLYHFHKRLRLDAGRPHDPKETPVIIANQSEFQAALAEAKNP
jgi:predicted DNA-binding transcriptional regulator YafY